MRFLFLKGFVRVEQRIFVFEGDDHADRDAIVLHAVDPAAAVHVGGERPAERVGDETGFDAAGRDVPQFLDTDSVDLRIDAVEAPLVDHFFGQRAAGAFGEDGDFGAKFVAGGEVVFGLAVFVDAFVFGDDAGDAVAFVDQFPTGELGEEIYAFLFDEAAEPFDQFVEGNDVNGKPK